LKLVVDTCVLKLATFPVRDNPSARIVQLAFQSHLEWWASPAIVDEYTNVLSDEPELMTEVVAAVQLCYPLTELNVIRHEPDNRFIECALAVHADYIVTVNTARGHFDQKRYGEARVLTPGAFVNLSCIQHLING
jgi:putative PIN family toxin of toxin-antitoxin system